jgi:hypothetical protein
VSGNYASAKQTKKTMKPILSTSLIETLWTFHRDCKCVAAFLRGVNDSGMRRSLLLSETMMGTHFSFRENDGMISYMPAGREQTFGESGKWERKGRQSIKPAKWLKSMLSPKLLKRFKDSDFATFSEKFRAAELAGKVSFEFVAFRDGYNSANYQGGSSDNDPANIHSCMWNADVAPFYTCFPARLLVAKNALGKFCGRAVVWTLATGETFMDRVYANSPEVTELFLEHAKENSWMRKTRQSTGTSRQVTMSDGTEIVKSMDVKAGCRPECDFWPYMDTFFSMNESETRLSNSETEAGYLLNSTGGEREEVNNHEGEVEDIDGEWISQDDAYFVEGSYYSNDDERICYCERSEEYILTCDSYTVETSRNCSITIHSRFVTQNS